MRCRSTGHAAPPIDTGRERARKRRSDTKETEWMRDPEAPKGTIALLLLYFLVIVALWGSAYMTMLSRGVTQ